MAVLTDEVEATHRVMVVGLSGAGKSTLLAELSKEFDLIWIDLDNSKDILVKLPKEQRARINYIRIPDSASYPIAVQTLMILFKNGKANICQAHGKHECMICKKEGAEIDSLDITNLPPTTIVVIDTGSQLASSMLAYVCKDKAIEYKPERDDWGGLRKYSEFFASQFQAFNGNLAVSFHAIEAQMEDDRIKLVPSFGSKDMSSKVAKAFGDVIYVDVKNKKHIAFSRSTASNTVLTKSRSDFAIEDLPEPSLIPLFKGTTAPKKDEVSGGNTPAQNAVKNLTSYLNKK